MRRLRLNLFIECKSSHKMDYDERIRHLLAKNMLGIHINILDVNSMRWPFERKHNSWPNPYWLMAS